MKQNEDGNFQKAKCYIARKEHFQESITNQCSLRVIAVYPDGQTEFTRLLGYIKETRLTDCGSWEVVVSGMKTGFVLVTII